MSGHTQQELACCDLIEQAINKSDRAWAETEALKLVDLVRRRNVSSDENEITTYTPDEPLLVRWRMKAYKAGDKEYPESIEFEDCAALAVLLINEVLFENAPWYRKDLSEDERRVARLHVVCNDVFAWGCSDAEDLTHAGIEPLYTMWEKDPNWGPAIWCMIQRKELGQRPVLERIRAAGIWDLDALTAEHGLRPNFYDGMCAIGAKLKYQTYSDWCRVEARDPLPFDKHWWDGWNEFVKAVPTWRSPEWIAEEERRFGEFKIASGHKETA